MRSRKPRTIVIPGLKLIVLAVLALILLQFWTTPTREVNVTEPAAFEELDRQEKAG